MSQAKGTSAAALQEHARVSVIVKGIAIARTAGRDRYPAGAKNGRARCNKGAQTQANDGAAN
jgi:hypothetical protein